MSASRMSDLGPRLTGRRSCLVWAWVCPWLSHGMRGRAEGDRGGLHGGGRVGLSEEVALALGPHVVQSARLGKA